MKKIRIGNDFVFSWAIERGGNIENLETVLEKHLYMIVFGTKTEIHNYTVSGNKIIVEFTPEMLNKIGIYTLIFYYVLPDESLSDNDRKCAVDIDAFQIVPRTAMADDVSEFAVTSDMAIAFKGDKGDPFTYDDFTPEQIEDLKRPAIEAAESVLIVENQVKLNEQGRVKAENEREIAETTRVSNENNRVTAEQERVEAESLRATAETSRQIAESLRTEAELLRQSNTQEAISNAESATENANTAAQNADDAREAIQDDLALKADQADLEETTEKPTAQSLSELNARITALEAIISNKIKDRIDVTKEFNVWGKTNLILYGDGASTKAPDFIGQTYIDTTNGNVYVAVGVSNAGNWKLV